MPLDRTFFRSKVARRIFILFICCAILPILALAALSLATVSEQLNEQSQKRLQQAAKAVGQSIIERLIFLDAELRLPFGLGIELDALYRRLNYTGVGFTPSTTATVSGNGLEFPLLAKYRFPAKVVRPFVDAGFAFNTLSGLKQSVLTTTGLSNAPVATKTGKGFVMGAGLDIHLLVVHFSPEIRYTHWGSTQFVDPLSLVNGNQNQAEFLVGITF